MQTSLISSMFSENDNLNVLGLNLMIQQKTVSNLNIKYSNYQTLMRQNCQVKYIAFSKKTNSSNKDDTYIQQAIIFIVSM